MKQKFNILIPMAGRGSRFTEQGYTDSKPFIDVDGKPMIQRVIKNLNLEFDEKYKFILICLKEDYKRYDFSVGYQSFSTSSSKIGGSVFSAGCWF